MIVDTIAATGGDRTKLSKIFDPSRSGYAINPLVGSFREAYAARQGSESEKRAAGKAAVHELLGRGMADNALGLRGQALVDDMMKDTNAALNDPGQEMKKHIETVRQSLMTALLPALEKLAQVLPGIVEKFT